MRPHSTPRHHLPHTYMMALHATNTKRDTHMHFRSTCTRTRTCTCIRASIRRHTITHTQNKTHIYLHMNSTTHAHARTRARARTEHMMSNLHAAHKQIVTANRKKQIHTIQTWTQLAQSEDSDTEGKLVSGKTNSSEDNLIFARSFITFANSPMMYLALICSLLSTILSNTCFSSSARS